MENYNDLKTNFPLDPIKIDCERLFDKRFVDPSALDSEECLTKALAVVLFI